MLTIFTINLNLHCRVCSSFLANQLVNLRHRSQTNLLFDLLIQFRKVNPFSPSD